MAVFTFQPMEAQVRLGVRGGLSLSKMRFDRAIIALPNGQVVDGRVSSWMDYENSDVVQITVEGKTYLTHYANVCLIEE